MHITELPCEAMILDGWYPSTLTPRVGASAMEYYNNRRFQYGIFE